jgi:ferric-dicitrate binding protein FerR (iron transport regulator)
VHEQGLSTAERRQFSDWLAESPAHVREYLSAGEVSGALAQMSAWPEDSTQDLLELVARERGSNVHRLDPETRGTPAIAPPTTRGARAWPRCAAAAVEVGIAIVLGWTRQNSASGEIVYQTARGEQRSVVLTDGSIAQLNTLTRLIVHFDKHERRPELPSGEALFRVAHDKARPFIVDTPYASVRAVGTAFNVYVAKLRISGVLNVDDPEALIQYQEEVKGVKVLRESGQIVLRR